MFVQPLADKSSSLLSDGAVYNVVDAPFDDLLCSLSLYLISFSIYVRVLFDMHALGATKRGGLHLSISVRGIIQLFFYVRP